MTTKLDVNLNNLSMDELLLLMDNSQKTLALSRFYQQSNEEIDRNIKQMDKLKKAIEEKRSSANHK